MFRLLASVSSRTLPLCLFLEDQSPPERIHKELLINSEVFLVCYSTSRFLVYQATVKKMEMRSGLGSSPILQLSQAAACRVWPLGSTG